MQKQNIIKWVNLTAHTINEVTTGTEIPASGIVCRLQQTTTKVNTYNRVPIFRTSFTGIEGLPEPVKGTIYIVSSLAMQAVPLDREDVVSPGNLSRDERGQPVGCTGFRTKQ